MKLFEDNIIIMGCEWNSVAYILVGSSIDEYASF